MKDNEDIGSKYKEYKSNPSIEHLDDFLKKIGGGKEKVVIYEKEGRVKYTVSNRRDKRKYAKFILYNGWLETITELDKSSIIVLFYILDNLKVGNSRIKLNSEEVCEVTKISRPTFYKAIYQLLDKEWLFRSTLKKYYFINMRRVSRGPAELVYQNHEIEVMRRENQGQKIDRYGEEDN